MSASRRPSTSLRRNASGSMKKKEKPKMVIKPFKVKPSLPTDFESTTQQRLADAVRAIHNKQLAAHSQEELYRNVESLCMHKKDEKLFLDLREQCNEHVLASVTRLVGRSPDPSVFLGLVDETWQDHCNQMWTIRSVFLYLDRTYVIQAAAGRPDMPRSLWDMGLKLFSQHLQANPEVLRKCVRAVLDLIEKERQGENVNRTLLRNVVRMFYTLGIYSTSFETPFLEASGKFFLAEGNRLMQQMNVPEYLLHVTTRLRQELDRMTAYLDESTKRGLQSIVERSLVANHVQEIIDNGFAALMSSAATSDLARMYFLISKVQQVGSLQKAFEAYIKTTGTSIVSVPERDKRMVEDLLELRDRLHSIWASSFNENPDFLASLKTAFESFINARENRPAELMARFVDGKLRSSNKGLTHDELDALLDKVMSLFRYVHGKDVFQAFYKKHLARRLLLGQSASKDAELSMISKIKRECGASFTKKLEGMFRDMELSAELGPQYQQYVKTQKETSSSLKDATPLGVHVLTTGHWPDYPQSELKVPPSVATSLDHFKAYYLGKYNGRKLVWQHALSSCILKAPFARGRKELAVSANQAVVLMLFNDSAQLSMQDIVTASGLDEATTRLTLQSLAHGEVRLLLQNPRNRVVKLEDLFQVNRNFKHALFRIKVPSPQMKETKAEQKRTTERVFADRQYAIDATVVRIMKARKTLGHQSLMAEVFGQLKFPATPQDIKKRIASLIEREYLERDSEDSHMYNYLA